MPTIPNEAWPYIVGLVVAFGYWLKRQGDGRLEGERARRIAAENELMQTQAEMKKWTSMTSMFQDQILINQQAAVREKRWLRALKRTQEAASSEYKVIRNVQNDGNTQLTNLYNAMVSVIKILESLPGVLIAASNQAVKDAAALTSAEIAAAITRQLGIRNVERTLHPFPESGDAGWRDDLVTPLLPEVVIHKDPYFDDDVKVKKSCSKINPDGERVQLIERPEIEAIAVYKVQDGVVCWGWLPAKSVRVGALQINPVST